MYNYLVLDIENNSSEEAKQRGRKAGSPFVGDELVAVGLKNKTELKSLYLYKQELVFFQIDEDILVGHNLSHDLMWFWDTPWLQEFFKRGGKIWDTQVIHYLLSGQEDKYPALRDIAVNVHKCSEREKLMEKYWEEGFKTSDIPKELVLKDVENDVLDTESIFLQQYKRVKELGLMNFIELQMDAVCATIEMSFNGMRIDQEKLNENKIKIETELAYKKEQLINIVKEYWGE